MNDCSLETPPLECLSNVGAAWNWNARRQTYQAYKTGTGEKEILNCLTDVQCQFSNSRGNHSCARHKLVPRHNACMWFVEICSCS